jgi:hypothetical protein
MTPYSLLLPFLAFLTVIPFAATIRLLGPLTESAKRFNKFSTGLRKRGKFKKWARQHRDLIVLDALLRFRGVIVLVLVASGLIPVIFSDSERATTFFYAYALCVWPVIYLGAVRLSHLYAQLPKSAQA